ncbi:MAG TPA: DUF4838 domain-containing protein [Tepidisphaeraceae bacterium]|jgi:hypothetical protein
MLKFGLAIIFCAGLCAHADVTIVQHGQSDFAIVCENSPPDTFADMRGARQLQSYIAQITGATLPIITTAQPLPDHAIIVGVNRYSKQLGLPADFEQLGDDGFIVKSIGNHILLAGPGKRGSMYACFALLEKLGVDWLTPTYTYMPHASTLSIPDLNETQTPSFEYREAYITEATDPDWCAHLRMNGSWTHLDSSYGGGIRYAPYFVHTLHDIIPAEEFAAHPDYFPLINGKRVGGNRVQRCLSNPAVLKIAIDTVNRWITENPDAAIVSVSQNDNLNYCTCDNCKKLIDQYGGPSGEYLWFANQVAAAVAKTHPHVLIDTLAYEFTEAPPKNIAPLPNVRVRLCAFHCDQAHPYEQSTFPATQLFLDHLNAWYKLTSNLYIWHYSCDFTNELMPFADFNQFPDSIRLYKRTGVKGIFIEGDADPGGGGSDAELRAYVMAHLLWDSNANANQLIDHWMLAVYGPANKPMRRWFDLVHQQVQPADRHLLIYDPPTPALFPPQVMTESHELLEQAHSIAADKPDPIALEYIEKAQLDWRYVDLMLHPDHGTKLHQFLTDLTAMGIRYPQEQRSTQRWLQSYLAHTH